MIRHGASVHARLARRLRQQQLAARRMSYGANAAKEGEQVLHMDPVDRSLESGGATAAKAKSELKYTPPAHDDAEQVESRLVLGKTREELFDEVEKAYTRWEGFKTKCGEWWQETKHHYVHGTKELYANVKTSLYLVKRSLHGHGLSRRERRLMTRTLGDVFRVVPMSVFVLIPFMEFLLPVALKVWPNMLPSTYDDPNREREKYAKRLVAQVELNKFLQDTLEEMAVTVKKNAACADTREMAAQFSEFLIALKTGDDKHQLSYDDLKKLLPLFNADLGLTKMRRPQLIAMCKLLETPYIPLASEESLRIGLRMHIRRLKRDDIAIQTEGIDSLDDKEVITACKMRAIRVNQKSPDIPHLRAELARWIDLSQRPGVSNSLLLISRVLPTHSIRSMASEAARDMERKEIEEIEKEVEMKAHMEESEQYWKDVHSEWCKAQAVQAATATAAPHVFVLSPEQMEQLQRQGDLQKEMQQRFERLKDAEVDIEELKEDRMEYEVSKQSDAADKEAKAPAGMAVLERKIEKNIKKIESQIRAEETDIVLDAMKDKVHEGEEIIHTTATAAATATQDAADAAATAPLDDPQVDVAAAATTPSPAAELTRPGGVEDVVCVTKEGAEAERTEAAAADVAEKVDQQVQKASMA